MIMVRRAGGHQQDLFMLIWTLVVGLLIDIDPIRCNRELPSDADKQFTDDYNNYYHTLGKRSAVSPVYENYNTQYVDKPSTVASGYLLADSTDSRLDLSKPLDRNLSIILDANGPDMRPSRDYNDFKNISIDLSIRAWELLREHATVAIKNRIDLAWPTINKLLHESNTSDVCIDAIQMTLNQAMRMDSWAIKLINSWGTFPMSGIFEGTYGDVGSFHTCVNIKNNKYIDHAHYCSVTFRPVMPSQRDYELVVRKVPDELRKFKFGSAGGQTGPDRIETSGQEVRPNEYIVSSGNNNIMNAQGHEERDAFSQMLEHAQYHHYVYYKVGTCWPIQCSPFDVKRITKLIARKNILLNGPVKCYSLNSTDYDEQYDESGTLAVVGSANDKPTLMGENGTTSTNSTGVNGTKTRRLVVSIWDKNGGIFVWKPHFNRAHKIALAIIVVVTVFILTMTAIDLFCNKVPVLIRKLVLSLKGLPLNYNPNRLHDQRSGVTLNKSFELCSSGGRNNNQPGSMTPVATRKHPKRPDFAMVPSEAATAFVQLQQQQQELNPAGCQEVDSFDIEPGAEAAGVVVVVTATPHERCFFMGLVDDCSILTNVPQFFRVSESQMKNDILCLNGIRCITMVWIIMTHTMMYNDWSAFGRTREVEKALNSLLSQPIFNGSYLVDSFFLMSGLLSAFTAFKHCQGLRAKFNSFAYIFGRWLRLTPQIFFVSMLYIVLPATSYGPHWFPIVGEFSENCVNNWWINVLHAQAFYKKDEMCNFVTWWISIDFFYHLFALIVIWIVMLAGHRYGFLSMAVIVLSQVAWQTKRHYELALPPNVLSTIPQAGAMWTTMTLDFYWTPYTHSVPFFFGFYIGYLMALKREVIMKNLNTRRALIGWFLSIGLLIGQSYCTYWWVTGKADWSRWFSTVYYGACSFIWASSLCWIIIACQHDYGGFVNRALSWKPFIVLGKASYLVYLSHFQILFLFYGNQNLMLEPTPITMIYIVFGNIFLSTLYGIFLCSVYELPWLKMHRRLMKYV